MLLRICSTTRQKKVIMVRNMDDFTNKVKQMLFIECEFRCVLEEDGSEIVKEVLEAILEENEKVGVLMILKEGEEWSRAEDSSSTTGSVYRASRTALDNANPSLPSLQPESAAPRAQAQNVASAPTRSFQDVRALLLRNPKGQRVVEEYDKYQTLSPESRQTLVKIAVAQLVEEFGPYPAKEQKERLASCIVACLPGLKAASGITGYEHFFSESSGQTGYIQERLKCVRRSLSSDAHQRPHKKQPQRAVANQPDDATCTLPGGETATHDLSDAEVTALRLECFYANPVTDRAVIFSGMAKTAAARQAWIRKAHPSITDILEQYPRLEDMPLDLLDIDFRLHFPDAVDNFLTEFPTWTRGVIAAARLSRRTDIVELIHDYDSQEHSNDVTARDIMYSVLALLYMLPSANTKHKAKLSSAELLNSLICFKTLQTSIDAFLLEKKSNTHKQPFLMCLGSIESPGVFYLILDSKAITLEECGVLKAVDCLFKAHYAYYVDYAKSVELFMEFLQKLIYKIECSKLSARVRELQNSIMVLRGGS